MIHSSALIRTRPAVSPAISDSSIARIIVDYKETEKA